MPISEKYEDYAKEVFQLMQENDIRGFIDHRDEKIGRKIRDAETSKVPFMLIVGEKEANEGKVSVRRHGEGDLGSFTQEEFMSLFQKAAKI